MKVGGAMDDLGVSEKTFQGPAWESDSRVGQRESERARDEGERSNVTKRKRSEERARPTFGSVAPASRLFATVEFFLFFGGRRLCSLGSTRTFSFFLV